jgi:hypothetical protein
MIPIGGIVKWIAIVSILGIIASGIKKGYEYHLDQIDAAVNAEKLESALAQNEAVRIREEELRVTSRKDRELIEVELDIERNKVNDLQRMLLIDHDLDRLLQSKPGLILIRVNKGTEQYFKTLEEVTQ